MTAESKAELAAIEQQIFARRPEHLVDPSLDRIIALTSLLGDPQRAYPVVHVTGTNGKTSTARMTETLLRVRGLRTGLFTSPHLISVRERISIDGEPLSVERFIEVYRELEPYLRLVDAEQPVKLSFFEVLTGMAFAAFADAPVDVAVVEVGMGGTWDNTNVADGVVAVVTPISIDHAQYLGNTVAAIAADKAGIIKPGAVAVLGQQPVDAAAELMRRAVKVGASVAREGIEFGVLSRELAVGGQRLVIKGLLGEYYDLFLPLFGSYQAGNAACALAAVEAFSGASGSPGLTPADETDGDSPSIEAASRGIGPGGGPPQPSRAGGLDDDLVRTAFAMMSSPGRLEIVRRSPVVIVDAAHNPAGMAATVTAVDESFGPAEVIAVVAVSADKDVAGILDALEPVAAGVVATTNSSPRAMPAADLAELAAAVFGPDRVHLAGRLDDAIEVAVGLADEASDALGGPLAGWLDSAGPGGRPPGTPGSAGPGGRPPGTPGSAGPGGRPPGTPGSAGPGGRPPGTPGSAGPGGRPPGTPGDTAESLASAPGTVVLITGSVVTAGDARLLLGAGGR